MLHNRIFGFLLLMGIAFYLRSWNSYFVCDDYEFLGRITLQNAGEYFHKSWAYGNEYRPLLPFSYALDALISGSNPIAYHVTNTLFQICNAWLLISICIHLALSRRVSLLAGVLYLANPVAHEAVLWISGRPVILSAFFMLLALWFLVAWDRWPRWLRLASSLLFFALGLLTYEGAIALPFIVAVLYLTSPTMRAKWNRWALVPFFSLLAIYLGFWFWIFSFHLVRQRQDSIFDGLRCFGQALVHSWHGAYRPEVGIIYLLLLAWFLLKPKNRLFAVGMFALFLAAFLPFFMSKGFAPRFAYLPSAALCVLLAAMVMQLVEAHKKLGLPFAAAVVIFYAIGMQNLIGQWKDAGEIARDIPAEILATEPYLPAGSTIAIAGVPPMYKHAYVYLTGLQRSLSRAYAEPVKVLQTGDAVCTASATRHYRYADGQTTEVHCR